MKFEGTMRRAPHPALIAVAVDSTAFPDDVGIAPLPRFGRKARTGMGSSHSGLPGEGVRRELDRAAAKIDRDIQANDGYPEPR